MKVVICRRKDKDELWKKHTDLRWCISGRRLGHGIFGCFCVGHVV